MNGVTLQLAAKNSITELLQGLIPTKRSSLVGLFFQSFFDNRPTFFK